MKLVLTSVERRHDGVRHIGVGEAKAVAQLMEDSLQQVRSLNIALPVTRQPHLVHS